MKETFESFSTSHTRSEQQKITKETKFISAPKKYKTINMTKNSNTIIVTILILTLLEVNQNCRAMSLNDIERGPFIIKRSLCNTFTGCGAKRSLQAQQQQPFEFELPGSRGSNFGTAGSTPSAITGNVDSSEGSKVTKVQSKRDTNANIMAEILGDLTDYLRANEKYWQGKYVVLVPTKQFNDNSPLNPSSFAVIGNNGQIQPLTSNELQEIQMGRVYLSKNSEQN